MPGGGGEAGPPAGDPNVCLLFKSAGGALPGQVCAGEAGEGNARAHISGFPRPCHDHHCPLCQQAACMWALQWHALPLPPPGFQASVEAASLSLQGPRGFGTSLFKGPRVPRSAFLMRPSRPCHDHCCPLSHQADVRATPAHRPAVGQILAPSLPQQLTPLGDKALPGLPLLQPASLCPLCHSKGVPRDAWQVSKGGNICQNTS